MRRTPPLSHISKLHKLHLVIATLRPAFLFLSLPFLCLFLWEGGWLALFINCLTFTLTIYQHARNHLRMPASGPESAPQTKSTIRWNQPIEYQDRLASQQNDHTSRVKLSTCQLVNLLGTSRHVSATCGLRQNPCNRQLIFNNLARAHV